MSSEKYDTTITGLASVVMAERDAQVSALDDSALEDLAHSANQEALSYGVSLDVFLRLAKTVRLRAATAPQPAAQALDAQRLTKASKDISTVLRVEGMDLEIGSRKLLKEAREAIDAAIAAQEGAKP